MSRKKVRQFLPAIEYMCNLGEAERQQQIKNMSNDLLKFYIDFLYSVYKKRIPLSDSLIDILRPHKTIITSLLTRNKSLAVRRRLLAKKNVFENIFCVLLPVLREQS